MNELLSIIKTKSSGKVKCIFEFLSAVDYKIKDKFFRTEPACTSLPISPKF